MSKYKHLIEAHGTLAEFTFAVELAYNDGFCTWGEKEEAIADYKAELELSEVTTEGNK